ncbi:hypothetical protein AVEN_83173-1 [Araneus ventricosus]|uniref:Uncharacterized protein n=1 Tax=Araneus ventricosus TaxID=182803 RepID=A0A4Y2AMT3_ARAVE|nr:hypothetical protein AVEN_83173-1 [Araneus ventricosus]
MESIWSFKEGGKTSLHSSSSCFNLPCFLGKVFALNKKGELMTETDARNFREEEHDEQLKVKRGRGGLVVRSQLRGRRVPESKPGSTKDPTSMWACCMLNHTQGSKRPPAGVVRKSGERVQIRCRPHHLTAVQNYEVHPKTARVLLQNGTLI